ncbi:MAG: BrnT family toxin [Betaproteobacteria bacterium]|nr:MAG: BrnT family toxin [Betaproteobacteria bacterium]
MHITYISSGMRFRYDPAKAAANFRKHGISFADAEGVFQDPLAVTMEDPDAEGERRFIAVGSGNATELLVVVYTMRGSRSFAGR